MASYSSIDLANADVETARRRELCTNAASKRASSSVPCSEVTTSAENSREILASKHLKRLVEGGTASGVASVSTDRQVHEQSLPGRNTDMQIDGRTSSGGEEAVGDASNGAGRVSNSIPAVLQRVLIAEHGRVCRATDLLVLAVHAVMLETGFVVVNALEEGYTLPGGWSNGGIAKISYTLPAMRDAGNISGQVGVKSLTLGNNVVIYGTITGANLQPIKLLLLASKYIVGSVISHTDPISSYSDLFELWRHAKDGLSLPLLMAVCEMAGLPAPSSFLALPPELKMQILGFLPALDLIEAGRSCSALRHLSENDELWKRLFLGEFGDPPAEQQLLSFRGWKDAYAFRVFHRKMVFEGRVLVRRPLGGNPLVLAPPPRPRMGSGIGGDYDVYPVSHGRFGGNFGGGPGPLGWLHCSFRDEDLVDFWLS